MTQTVDFVQRLLAKPETQQACIELVKYVLSDESTIEAAKQFSIQVLQDEKVQDLINAAFKDAAIYVLNDENVKEQAKLFVEGILQDQHVRADAGDALWHAVKHSITPSFFR